MIPIIPAKLIKPPPTIMPIAPPSPIAPIPFRKERELGRLPPWAEIRAASPKRMMTAPAINSAVKIQVEYFSKKRVPVNRFYRLKSLGFAAYNNSRNDPLRNYVRQFVEFHQTCVTSLRRLYQAHFKIGLRAFRLLLISAGCTLADFN